MKRFLSMLAFASVTALSCLSFSGTAHADTYGGVTCTVYQDTNQQTNWPNDNKHFWKCFNATADRLQQTVAAGVYIPHIFIEGYQLANWNSNIYYFANRSDSNAYMKGKYPSLASAQSTTSRCGNTAFNPASNGMTKTPLIVSEIYDTCTMQTQKPTSQQNVWLTKVVAHEVGHAFDFGLSVVSKSGYGKAISTTTGFKAMVTGVALHDKSQISDLPELDNGTIGGSAPSTCGVFSTITMTSLELDLGAKYPTPVCIGSTIQPKFVGAFNSAIATEEEPYFITPGASLSYEDMFAEAFAVLAQEGSSSPALPQMDTMMSAFRCTYNAVAQFTATALPPTAQILAAYNCPAETSASFDF